MEDYMQDFTAPRPRILKAYLYLAGLVVLFWWPLSHWFYSDWYHSLLGFESWDQDFSRIIGTCGLCVTAITFLAARNPARNRDMILVLIGFALAMAATYAYLILFSDFPGREWGNVGFCLVNACILFILRPERWKPAP